MTQGFVADGYQPVADAFDSLFTDGLEDGGSLALYRHGQAVLDLWGGVDPDDGTPWEKHSVGLGFSTTKGAATICLLRLAERGLIDLQAPVARYWPDFAAEGKADITVYMVLRHLSALPYLPGPLEQFYEPGRAESSLAARPTYYPADSTFIYHAITFGTLVGEIVRRVSGKPIGEFFADEVAGPLGLEFWIGLPEAEEGRFRRSTYRSFDAPPSIPDEALKQLPADVAASVRTFQQLAESSMPPSIDSEFNSRGFRAAALAGASGANNGRALARMYAALIGEVDGVRLLSAETVAAAGVLTTGGVHRPPLPDGTPQPDPRWGIGFHLDDQFQPMLGEGSFGHTGLGGRLGFAHPASGIGFGYVSQRMELSMVPQIDERMRRLIAALHESL